MFPVITRLLLRHRNQCAWLNRSEFQWPSETFFDSPLHSFVSFRFLSFLVAYLLAGRQQARNARNENQHRRGEMDNNMIKKKKKKKERNAIDIRELLAVAILATTPTRTDSLPTRIILTRVAFHRRLVISQHLKLRKTLQRWLDANQTTP